MLFELFNMIVPDGRTKNESTSTFVLKKRSFGKSESPSLFSIDGLSCSGRKLLHCQFVIVAVDQGII